MTIELNGYARWRASCDLGFYQSWRTQDDPHRPVTPARYCECGTKLRRTKSAFERLCDSCDDARRLATNIVELHPAPHRCVDCDTPIDRKSKGRCQACYQAIR